ncbi:MAG: hypothetical protein P8J78_04525 [Maricaulis sp.]|jgi:DNA-binding transcriptional ArsR family regulator|nr:hypothetical protein [Maricaulis sp.]MDG2043856.1 hypothetical protein [Maricaulis sp.]
MAFNPVKIRQYGEPKEVVARLFEEAGGVPKVMEILDLSRTRVYALADPDSSNEISYTRVAALTGTGATAAAQHLSALAGGLFVPVEKADETDWLALAGEASQRNAKNISAIMESLSETVRSPGEIDAKEARDILKILDEQLGVLAMQRAKLAAIAAGDADGISPAATATVNEHDS